MTSEGKQQRFEMPVKRNMGLIIGNNGLGVIADAIFELGVLWYVLDRTESAFITSIITTLSMCIHVFAGPFIGVIVDRMNPKSALKNAYVAMGLVGIIMVVSYLFFINYIVFSILAVVVLNNLAQMFINPSITRMLPQLIGMERIAEVKGYLSTANSTASLIGNALAGFLLTMIGFVGVMLTHSFIFLLAALLTLGLVVPNAETKETAFTRKGYWQDFRKGVEALKSHQALLVLTLMNMGINIFSIGYLYIVIFKNQYHGSSSAYGVFEATGVIASMMAGLLAGRLAKKMKPGLILMASLILSSSCMILIGMCHHLILMFIFSAIQNFMGVLYMTVFSTLSITLVNPELRARVNSLVIALSSLAMPITTLLGGFLADVLPIKYIFYVSGCWGILMGLLPLFNKEVRGLEKLRG